MKDEIINDLGVLQYLYLIFAMFNLAVTITYHSIISGIFFILSIILFLIIDLLTTRLRLKLEEQELFKKWGIKKWDF